MGLKREIAELEQVEEMQEEEELTEERRQAEQRSIDEKVVGLYRRINIIVECIDNQTREVTTITEEQLRQDERHFREEGIRKAWELKALELTQKNKDITKLLKEKENEKNIIWDNAFQEGVRYAMGAAKKTASSEYAKGYEDGIKILSEKLRVGVIQMMEENRKEDKEQAILKSTEAIFEMVERAASNPDLISSLAERLSRSVRSDKKENEESEKSQGTDRPKGEKSRVVGLGRKIGDV